MKMHTSRSVQPQLQPWYLEIIQSNFRAVGLWIGQITEKQKRAEVKYRTVKSNLNSWKNTKQKYKDELFISI